MTTEDKKMYYGLKSLDLFLNINSGSDKIKNMLDEVKQRREDAETAEIKFVWMQIESALNQTIERIVDGLKIANKKAIDIGYKITSYVPFS